MGREKFDVVCFAHGSRVKKPKNFRVTSDSRGVTHFPDLIKELGITSVIQALVSDKLLRDAWKVLLSHIDHGYYSIMNLQAFRKQLLMNGRHHAACLELCRKNLWTGRPGRSYNS